MKFDIDEVIKQMIGVIKDTVDTDSPVLKETANIFLSAKKERLGQLVAFRISGEINEQFFASRMADEQLILESELHAMRIITKAVAQRAANAAIDVLSKAVLSAITPL
ncbi:MAG: hypothetical protein JWN56_1063 [Sphingobacteriales bacterium]|nr:hypothetical protein [Sphingobacteriales bacterium]